VGRYPFDVELFHLLLHAGSSRRFRKYAIRAGAEATIHQAVTTGGMRRARYRGLPKVALQHAFAATAINLIRLHEWWTRPPLHSARKASHLTRLNHALAA